MLAVVSGLLSMGWIAIIIYLAKKLGASFLDDEHRRVDVGPGERSGRVSPYDGYDAARTMS